MDFELYLPASWIEDPRRRLEARIPDATTFKTKVQLALDMIGRAKVNGIPGDILLADSAYGDSTDFRNASVIERAERLARENAMLRARITRNRLDWIQRSLASLIGLCVVAIGYLVVVTG